MGKWSQVRCNCYNRIPLPKSGRRDRPYLNRTRRKLSSQQAREIEIWEKNAENMYECGHREGMLVQFWPGEIIRLGWVVNMIFKTDLTFEIYPKVGNWRNYFSDELGKELHISSQEAELWLMEAAELKQAFLGYGNIPYRQVRQIISTLYQVEAKSHNDLKQRLRSAVGGFARVTRFLDNLDDEPASPESIMEQQFSVIEDTTKLCEAAIDSGNPVELLW